MLGVNSNNLKHVILNFIIVFLVQVAFMVNDIINLGRYPTEFELAKIFCNALITTLIFYGYNRLTRKEKS